MEVNPFKRKAAEERQRRQAESVAKAEEAAAVAKAKAIAKKKANRAVEDSWFHDGGSPGRFDSDSDEEDGLKMVDPMDFFNSQPSRARAPVASNFKIKNLIDFDECDLAVEESVPTLSHDLNSSMSNSSRSTSASSTAPGSLSADGRGALNWIAPERNPNVGMFESAPDSNALLAEIDSLKLMLATADAEKRIQMEIVAEEKQFVIDKLQCQVKELSERPTIEAFQRLRSASTGLKVPESARSVTPSPVEELEATPSAGREAALERELDASRAENAKLQLELVRCRDGVQLMTELQEENAQLRALAAEPAVPHNVAAVLMEIRALSLSVHENLRGSQARLQLSEWDTAQDMEGVERQLRDLRMLIARVQVDSEVAPQPVNVASEANKILREVRVDAEKTFSWIARVVRG